MNTFLGMTFTMIIQMTQSPDGFPEAKSFFDGLDANNIHLVDQFYDASAVLIDPVGEHNGRDNIKNYYAHLYQNINEIRFEYSDEVKSKNQTVLFWTMIYKHPRIGGGKEIRVKGNSHIRYSETTKLAIYHRDYFDMGEMVYEQIPGLSFIIGIIKSKMSQK